MSILCHHPTTDQLPCECCRGEGRVDVFDEAFPDEPSRKYTCAACGGRGYIMLTLSEQATMRRARRE